jgi:hypothetical protein
MGNILGDASEHSPQGTGWGGATSRRAGARMGVLLLLLGVMLLLWRTAADVTWGQREAMFREELLAKALQAAGQGLSHTKFHITANTSVTLRPQRPCASPALGRLCYEFRVTTPSGPRAPTVEEHFTIAIDLVSGEAVFENTTEK